MDFKHAHKLKKKKKWEWAVNTQIPMSQFLNKSRKLPGLGGPNVWFGIERQGSSFPSSVLRSQSLITHKLMLCISSKNIFTSVLEGNRAIWRSTKPI